MIYAPVKGGSLMFHQAKINGWVFFNFNFLHHPEGAFLPASHLQQVPLLKYTREIKKNPSCFNYFWGENVILGVREILI